MAKPSRSDYIVGPVNKFVYYLITFMVYSPVLKNSCVASTLILWRIITNSALVMLILPRLVNGVTLKWLGVAQGFIGFFECLALSLLGALLFFTSIEEGHERLR